jgi:hypothetical protein
MLGLTNRSSVATHVCCHAVRFVAANVSEELAARPLCRSVSSSQCLKECTAFHFKGPSKFRETDPLTLRDNPEDLNHQSFFG